MLSCYDRVYMYWLTFANSCFSFLQYLVVLCQSILPGNLLMECIWECIWANRVTGAMLPEMCSETPAVL